MQHLLGRCTHLMRDVEHAVVTIGHGGLAEAVRRRGAPVIGHLPATPGARAMSAGRSLRHLLAHRRYDLVHGWGVDAAATAMRAPVPTPCVATVDGVGRGVTRRLLIGLARRRPAIHLVTIGLPAGRDRSMLEAAGVEPTAITAVPPPALVDAPATEPVASDRFTLALMTEPASHADAWAAVSIVARVAVSGRAVDVAVHPAAGRRLKSQRWLRTLRRSSMLRLTTAVECPWSVACDVALHLPAPDRYCSVLPLLWTMARGGVVLAEHTPTAASLIEHDVAGLLVRGHDVNGSSRVLIELHDDTERRRRIGAAAAEAVRTRSTVDEHVATLKRTYDAIVGVS